MIITNLGQQFAASRVQSGQVLPYPTVQRVASEPTEASRVTLSADSASRQARSEQAEEKYNEAVRALNQASSASQAEKGEAAEGLASLPPLKFFTEDDVKAYEEQLMATLAARGVDTSIPIKLKTNFEGKVEVVGDHPDKAAIEQAFEDDNDLRNGFVQSNNYFLFKEMAALHEQWAEKIEQGMAEETANLWLINAVQNSVAKSSNGLTLENGGFNDPFAKGSGGTATASAAVKAYQA